jgi:4-hydroxythreonine-4-phosphate dehydrogenase
LLIESLIRDFGVVKPRIAVLGLNPHAGDNGLLGDEEKEVISPVVKSMFDAGMLVFGPYGADGFFGATKYKMFDGVMAMYHDQGLIPFKALAFDSGVNFTAGLPIVRTSPDHGTAYDIVNTDAVDSGSLRNAIFVARDIYLNRKAHKEMTSNPLVVTPKEERGTHERN